MDPVTTTTTLASMASTTLPTMGGDPAAAAGGLDLNVWSLIQQGALSTYPLLFCSVLVVAIALERAWALRGVIAQAGKLVGVIAPALSRGDLAAAQGALGNTSASAAPFIGLFGTVMGIIRSFHTMAIAGTGGFAIVAGGISEALIATALGLAVGIVA